MAELLLTAGEALLLRTALKRRLAELGRPGPLPGSELREIETITRLLTRCTNEPSAEPVRLQTSAGEAELIAGSLGRTTGWQRSMLPQAHQRGVLASLCRKVAAATPHSSSLPQWLAKQFTGMLHREAS